MHIFIDESGVFRPEQGKPDAFSCIGAVVVPSRFMTRIQSAFTRISASWPKDENGEIKGRLLNEEHITSLCDALQPYKVLFETVVTPMNAATYAEMNIYKSDQNTGEKPSGSTSNASTTTGTATSELESMEPLSNQLYAQMISQAHLVQQTIQIASMYFSQRIPRELAAFRWFVDRKDISLTPAEQWWRNRVGGFLTSQWQKEPENELVTGEYSPLSRQHNAEDMTKSFFRDLTFTDSASCFGLQIADILTSAIRRALGGNLQRNGWSAVHRLLINRPRGVVRFVKGKNTEAPKEHASVTASELDQGGRNILLSNIERPVSKAKPIV